MFKTKTRGMWATFDTSCHRCGAEITVTNGRPDPHTCTEPRPLTLDDLRAALGRRE